MNEKENRAKEIKNQTREEMKWFTRNENRMREKEREREKKNILMKSFFIVCLLFSLYNVVL